jgi:hypothetical protein
MCGEDETNMSAIDIEIEDSLLFDLMKRAHEADLTFNKYIERLLLDHFNETERDS